MRNSAVNRTAPWVIILIFHLVQTAQVYAWLDQYKVNIVNAMRYENLAFHCQSKDTDFGWKTLPPGQNFSWTFRENFLRNTLYFCRFRACGEEMVFDVFNKQIADDWCYQTHACAYAAAERYPFAYGETNTLTRYPCKGTCFPPAPWTPQMDTSLRCKRRR